jgi:hypothetical protein
MGFSAKQLRALKRNPDKRDVRTRESHGRSLTYLEGWFAVAEANRIFGSMVGTEKQLILVAYWHARIEALSSRSTPPK